MQRLRSLDFKLMGSLKPIAIHMKIKITTRVMHSVELLFSPTMNRDLTIYRYSLLDVSRVCCRPPS